MRSSILISALAAAAFGLPSMATAQDYPTRPIKAVTTTSAGGISDVFMRALGDELHKRWGQPIIVENRPGGMQNVGARVCTEAAPDGYTICILNAEPMAYNQFLLKNMPFDPEKGAAAGHQPLSDHPDAGGELLAQGQDHRRADRLVESEAGHAELPHRRRPARALHGDAGQGEGRRLGARAVQGRRRGGQRGAQRLDADRADRRGQRHRANPRRHHDRRWSWSTTSARPISPTCRRWKRPATTARRRAAGTGCSRRPARPSRSSTSSPRRSPTIVNDPAFRARHLTARSLVPAINTPEQFAEEIKKDRVMAERVVKEAGLTPQ